MASSVSVLVALRKAASRKGQSESEKPADAGEESTGLGRLATAWIGVMILGNAWAMYRLWAVIQDFMAHPDPRWEAGLSLALPSLIGFGAMNVVGLGLVLFRLKFGLFLLLLGTASSVMINIVIGIPPRDMLPAIIGFVVLALVLIPRWGRLR